MISKLRRRRDSRFALIAASLALVPAAAAGASVDGEATVVFAMPDAGARLRPPARSPLLKAGLDALSRRWTSAGHARIRDGLPENSLDQHILAWAIAMRGRQGRAERRHRPRSLMLPDWPGMTTLRRNSERAFYRENPDAKRVIASSATARRRRSKASSCLPARMRRSVGSRDARAVLSPFWRTEKLEAPEEQRIIKEFGAILQAADHRARMERMLYAERVNSAERVAKLAGAEPLAKAWTAVIRGEKTAPALLKAVPAEQRSAGYCFRRSQAICAGRKKFAEAAASHAEGADRSCVRRRCRRVVARAARAVARTRRPGAT